MDNRGGVIPRPLSRRAWLEENKFCACAIPPMTEKNSCERSFALRNNQIRRDRSTFRTDVSHVVKTASVEFFDDLVMYVERRFRVIVERVECGLVVGCGRGNVLGSR